jgi:hypothetical protein
LAENVAILAKPEEPKVQVTLQDELQMFPPPSKENGPAIISDDSEGIQENDQHFEE